MWVMFPAQAAMAARPTSPARCDGSEVVMGGTPDELSGFVRSETAKWTRVVKESGARIE